MPDFFSLSARGFITMVLVAGGGVTPAEGARCPGAVPASATVTTPADVVDGSVLVVSAEPPAGTSSPANLAPTTFWRLGLGGEAEGLQNRQLKHSTTTRLDNSTRWRLHTWWVRLQTLCVCVPPDDPEGPMARLLPTPWMIWGSCSCSPSLQLPSPPGGSRSWSSRRWQSIRCLSFFRFSRGAGKKVVQSGDVRLWWITLVQHCVSVQRILS
jgi:hypothetical protein